MLAGPAAAGPARSEPRHGRVSLRAAAQRGAHGARPRRWPLAGRQRPGPGSEGPAVTARRGPVRERGAEPAGPGPPAAAPAVPGDGAGRGGRARASRIPGMPRALDAAAARNARRQRRGARGGPAPYIRRWRPPPPQTAPAALPLCTLTAPAAPALDMGSAGTRPALAAALLCLARLVSAAGPAALREREGDEAGRAAPLGSRRSPDAPLRSAGSGLALPRRVPVPGGRAAVRPGRGAGAGRLRLLQGLRQAAERGLQPIAALRPHQRAGVQLRGQPRRPEGHLQR